MRILPALRLGSPPGRRPRAWRPGPLAGRYPAAAAMVVLFLVPYLGLSSALRPLAPLIAGQLHMSAQALSLTSGMANAGYAVGAVLAVQFAQFLPQRRMLLAYGALLVTGSVLAAAAAGPAMFIAGHILQGLCTSLLLIAAAPPLFLGFPAARLRWSAVIMNMCLFGAVTAGPLIGGAQASFHAWRPLFWIVAGIAAGGLVMSLLTFQDAPPADRAAPRDPAALGLAASGSVAAFWGASELTTRQFLAPVVVVPLLAGLALLATLWVYQYRARRPLLVLRSLASTIPVAGVAVAMCAAAAATSALGLTAAALAPRYAPLHLGLLFVPELGGAVLASIALGAVLTTRGIHYFVLAGMCFLTAGILVLRAAVPPTAALTLAGSGLTGVGIGASVTPALLLAGFSVRSAGLQRVFSILELMRAVAAFLIAPILLHFAVTPAGRPTLVTGTALWICFALSAGGALAGVALYLLGGARPSAPAVQQWMDGPDPAWQSPPLLAAIRRRVQGRVPAGRPAPAGCPGQHAAPGHGGRPGRVVFGYDGSDLAKAAIAEAGRQLPAGRDALVLTAWRTFHVEFAPEPGTQFDAACAGEVKQAAEQTAAAGAALAEAAGFRARGLAVGGTPTWKAISDVADEHEASLIVLGSHGRAGLGGHLAGSVAGAVAAHSRRPVLIVHDHGAAVIPAPGTAPSASPSSQPSPLTERLSTAR
jgi:nucleotide-binding universal stress UspA family protein/MFS family permease